jgi:hypothetical protein
LKYLGLACVIFFVLPPFFYSYFPLLLLCFYSYFRIKIRTKQEQKIIIKIRRALRLIFFVYRPPIFSVLFLFYKNKNKKGWALLLLCFYSFF